MRSSGWFTSTIRRCVAGATLVTEILDSTIEDNQLLINEIINEYELEESKEKLALLVSLSQELSRTMSGRIEIRRLADYYRDEANWPTDDISLRRAYLIYKNGELGKYLPQINEVLERLG